MKEYSYNFNTNDACDCGSQPNIVWHYIQGIANKVNCFVQCNNCKTRTRDRKSEEGAISDWCNKIRIVKEKR